MDPSISIESLGNHSMVGKKILLQLAMVIYHQKLPYCNFDGIYHLCTPFRRKVSNGFLMVISIMARPHYSSFETDSPDVEERESYSLVKECVSM